MGAEDSSSASRIGTLGDPGRCPDGSSAVRRLLWRWRATSRLVAVHRRVHGPPARPRTRLRPRPLRFRCRAASNPALNWPQLTGPDRVWTDGSGRTVADVTIHYPNLDRTKQLRFWFAWQDGQVRIDEVDGEITFAVP